MFRKTIFLFSLIIPIIVFAAQTGKIAGRLIDSNTGEPIVGANVFIEEISLGAATDLEGFFFILNIPPGKYTVKASTIGYATIITQNVQVVLDQTTSLNLKISEELLEGETIVVEAERAIIQRDVSSSKSILTAEAIEGRPLDNFEEIMSTEVGIELESGAEGTGMIVRGGNLNETDLILDGISTRNARTQQPNTNINLTAIKEIEILTGGFTAEYGDIRSGMINVITREGDADRYSVYLDGRISPPGRKHFGPSPYSTEGPFWTVYAGDKAFTGVTPDMVKNEGYAKEFAGWNAVSEQLLKDTNPDNDMTPQALYELWKWQHRLREYADKPDYIMDASLSGPIPLTPVSFLLSQRYEDLQLVYPFSRNNSIASTTLLKLTTRITPTMKLSWNNSYMLTRGVSGNRYDDTNGMVTGTSEGSKYAQRVFSWETIWHDGAYNPIENQQFQGGVSLNHVLNNKTFYDLYLQYNWFQASQEPSGLRDTTGIKLIGDTWYDETPFGYFGSDLGNISSKRDFLDEFYMSTGGRGQDHSSYWGILLRGDIVSQLTNTLQVKAGFVVDYTEFKERREINHGRTTTPREIRPDNWWYFDAFPIKISAYVQTKLEFEGFISNIGVRMDYMNPHTDAYALDPDYIYNYLPYDLENYVDQGLTFNSQKTDASTTKLYISPRLGISHPVTETSKIFFNYGHFIQPPVVDQLFTVKPDDNGSILPNYAADWPLTISYEIGFEQSIANSILIRMMGYYKDVSNQLSRQDIVSINNESVVSTLANNSYADIRGIEMKVEKRYGRFWYGWIALEYRAKSTGYTGLRYIYEDRQLAKQEMETTVQNRGWPVPSVSANIIVQTPEDYGPIFGDWRLNWIQRWSDGGKILINPDATLSEQHWADVIDYFYTNIMLEKRIRFGGVELGVYMQVKNLFNYRGVPRALYSRDYIDSLHFPWEQGSQKGNDKYGDYEQDYIVLGFNDYQHWVNPRDIFFGLKVKF